VPREAYDISLDQEKELYLQGIVHFNAHDFFEAHEVWEDAWKDTTGRRCAFYQGLIQMAVTLVHYQRRNGLGVRRVFARAQERWRPLPGVYMGLDLRAFEKRMQQALDDVLTADPGQPVTVAPTQYFAIELLYDPFARPRAEADD
jgi:hypothetical protein